jgi:hypothetical protein
MEVSQLFATGVQRQEIEKIPSDTKKQGIKQMVGELRTDFRPTSAAVVALDQPGEKGYNGSRVDCARVASKEDIHLLETLTKVNMIRPLKNRADLLTFYTAIKEDMDFLVTENIDDFEKPLKLFKMERGTQLQLRNITDFEKMLKSTTTQDNIKQVKHYKG